MHLNVHIRTIYNSQDIEATQVPINWWMDKKEWYIYIMKYYSAIPKNEILPFVAIWMDLETIMLSEISQRKTNTVWYYLFVESKK